MGGVVGSPVSNAKQQEIKELIEAVVKAFSVRYTKAYGIALLQKIKDDLSVKPGNWLLQRRPTLKQKQTLKEGYLTKEGAIHKNWRKRYFVVWPNYHIDYYESQEAYKVGKKPKGTIKLCGYTVHPDAQREMMSRLQEIAEKMGAETSDLPRPRRMPDRCFEIFHSRRRSYYIYADSNSDNAAWLQVFRQCAWHCNGFTNPDPVARKAFVEAIHHTRWELGRYGWWHFGGTEQQVLSDLIIDELNWTLLSDIYINLRGPWTIRWNMRSQLLKALDSTVNSAVEPAFRALDTAVRTLRAKVEGMIRENVNGIIDTEDTVQQLISDNTLEIIQPTIKEKVSPRLAGVIQILIIPITDAFTQIRFLFDQRIGDLMCHVHKCGLGNDLEVLFRPLDETPHSQIAMAEPFRKVNLLEEPLWALRQYFDDIHPMSLIYKAHNMLRQVLDNAFYTFEEELLKEIEDTPANVDGFTAQKAVEKARDIVQVEFSSDSNVAMRNYYRSIMTAIVLPFLQKILNPVCKPCLESVQKEIPHEFTDIIDVENMFERLLEKHVQLSIDKVVDRVAFSSDA